MSGSQSHVGRVNARLLAAGVYTLRLFPETPRASEHALEVRPGEITEVVVDLTR